MMREALPRPRTVAVVTGTRAEFGLLAPIIDAVAQHPDLQLHLVVTGAHLLPPARTIDDVARRFPIAATVEMQRPGESGRAADAIALGRGVQGLARTFTEAIDPRPEVVVVLGDRIEAFAAASAAAVAGIRIAHLHGGDRAEGVADESMRHAMTKLAHIHLPATEQSAERIVRLGEERRRVHVVGSPAVDGIDSVPPLDAQRWTQLGSPDLLVLFHPIGRTPEQEEADARRLLRSCAPHGRVLALDPNHDPGREGIVNAIETAGVPSVHHLPREQFIGLLRRARAIIGNSSAGLIEAAVLGVPAINLGPRQAGREMPASVTDLPEWDEAALDAALRTVLARPRAGGGGPGRADTGACAHHPYGDGNAGPRTASLLAEFDPLVHGLRKRNTF